MSRRAEVGIGALIIFIGMVLVAGIAAAVVISSGALFQSQAMDTGKAGTKAISNGFEVISISGTDVLDTNIDRICEMIKLNLGSEDIKMDGLMITLSTPDFEHVYVPGGMVVGPLQGGNVYTPPVSVFDFDEDGLADRLFLNNQSAPLPDQFIVWTGKTLIADYIIDKSIKNDKKVIYTAPIKALSNQKFKEFCESYGENKIGLITGDVVINSGAEVLIMTTEIYRNMLLTNDPLIEQVSYVVFDEIHYINDIERGTVWEESVIFSPEHIRFLCLSATIPNALEFAGWIESIMNHKVDVVTYMKRAVPLKHYVYDKDAGIIEAQKLKELAKVDKFNNYDKIYKKRGKGKFQKGKQKNKAATHIDLIREITAQNAVPAIFFIFSRKACEQKAEVGIGALIIFIGMVLVAGIAAAVVISSGALFQSQAMDTGKAGTKAISNGFEVISISGTDVLDTNIDRICEMIKLNLGSEDIKMDGLMITLSTPDFEHVYVPGGMVVGPLQGGNVYTPPVSVFDFDEDGLADRLFLNNQSAPLPDQFSFSSFFVNFIIVVEFIYFC